MISLPETKFTSHLIQENGLDAHTPGTYGFARWAFVPGMTFGSPLKWWGDRGQREQPHEGIDLCLFQDRQGKLNRLYEQTRLPAMYGGTVVRLCDDFLGRSVMIECYLPGQGILYSLYGHTVPRPDLQAGQAVREGEVIAYLAPLPSCKTGILPHLHISLGWAPGAVACDELDWEKVADVLTLLDPASVLDRSLCMIDPAQGLRFYAHK